MKNLGFKQRASRDQRGSVALVLTLTLTVLLALGGLGADIGYVLYVQKQLQAATDAAALAGAADLWNNPFATAKTNALKFTAGGGSNNLASQVVVSPATITGLQLKDAQLPFSGAVSKFNGIEISQQANVPLFFAKVVGFKTMTVSANSKAAAGGAGGPAKYNVMIVLDTTGSMNTADSNCLGPTGKSLTRLQCAQQAAMTLLTNLTNAGNNVGLMVYPPLAGSSKNNDFSCGAKQTGIAASYSSVSPGVVTSGATYQVSGLSSGYLSNGAPNTSSSIVNALGGGGCSGIAAVGGLGTYYAQAIASAQAALEYSSQSQNPPGQNVIILLSDGDATSSETQLGNAHKSDHGQECKAAVGIASSVRNTGTLIYTVAYIGKGSTTASCGNGNKDFSPCETMLQIASGPSYFFSDNCPKSAGGSINLNAAFKTISYTLTKPRLIPSNAS